MATSRSCKKCLKSTFDIVFYCICLLKSCNLYMKKAVFRRCSIKKVLWKTSQNPQVNIRSSHPEVLYQKGVLKKLVQFTEKHLYRGLPLMNLQAANLKLYQKRDSNTALRVACFETTVLRSLCNKVTSLMTRRHVTLLERDSSTGVSLWILRNFQGNFFAEYLLKTTSDMMYFFPFCRSMKFAA